MTGEERREYNRLKKREWRAKYPEKSREYEREYLRKWRARKAKKGLKTNGSI